ncbi:hypothetical protein PanWU01x14_097530 [Parasponia andersonii]|uniref:Uncharacterized protein n=1 Tax=Parasponia andersonii TaxID=3476 RepID=A0A2P5D4F8_PARAD|nr:hypothetical protein PanWU01x14_097530 [Parasponia andersonii]
MNVELDDVEAFREVVESFSVVKRLSRGTFLLCRNLLSISLLNAFNSFTISCFLLSPYLLLMCLPGLGHLSVVDKSEAHKTESLVIDLHIYRPRFAFSLINGQDIEMSEDASEKETIRKRRSPTLYSIDHLMKNKKW